MLSPLDINRTIMAFLYKYDESKASDEFLQKLLDRTMEEGFYTYKGEGNGPKIDKGIFAMTFWLHCLFLQPKSISYLSRMIEDVRKIADEASGVDIKFKESGKDLRENFLDIQCNQLLEGLLILKYLHKDDQLVPDIDQLLEQLTKAYFLLLKEKNYNTKSHFQKNMNFFLKKKIFPNETVESEFRVPPFSVDFLIPAKKLIIECHGKQHFLFNTSQLKFTDKRKVQILESMGYKVIEVPIHQWEALNPDKKENYLLERIKEKGIGL